MPTHQGTSEPGKRDEFASQPDSEGYVLGQVKGFPWWIRARVELVDGVNRITSLHLQRGAEDVHHAVITADVLRRLPLRTITAGAAGPTQNWRADADDADWVSSRETAEKVAAARRRDSRARLTDAHYQAVATIYAEEMARSGKGRLAVAEHFGVGLAMASKYVKEARRRELLPPFEGGST